MSEYMTTAEVGELLRAPVETVRYWRHVGEGPPSFKVGRRVLYAREDVMAFVEAARAKGHQVKQLPPTHVRLDRTAPKSSDE